MHDKVDVYKKRSVSLFLVAHKTNQYKYENNANKI